MSGEQRTIHSYHHTIAQYLISYLLITCKSVYNILIYFSFQACHLDPMLDDSIMFAKKLDSLNKDVTLDVIDDLPHGFLNFVLVSKGL